MTCLENFHSTYIASVEQREPGRRAGEFTTAHHLQVAVHRLVRLSSITLVGEADRKVLKAVIRHSAEEDQVRHRVIPSDTVAKYTEKLESLKGEISEIMKEEKEEKLVCSNDVSSGALLINF